MRGKVVPMLMALLAIQCMSTGARAEISPSYQMVVVTENFPPFSMANENKNYAKEADITGVNKEVVQEMFKRANIHYDMTLRFPWDRIYKLALDNPDYGVFSTTMNDARKPLFKWVGPLSITQRVFVAAPDSKIQIQSLDDTKKYRVGSYKKASTGEFLDKHNIPYESGLRDQENAKKLMDGKIDLWATNDPVFRYFEAQEHVKDLKVVFVAEAATQQYLAINLNTPDEVVQALQKALDSMRDDGTIKKLGEPYLGNLK